MAFFIIFLIFIIILEFSSILGKDLLFNFLPILNNIKEEIIVAICDIINPGQIPHISPAVNANIEQGKNKTENKMLEKI